MSVVTRFPPSPTGALHIGGARTALFNWAFARHHGGRFILRMVDTDRARSTLESERAILDGLAWLGLDHDPIPGLGAGAEDIPRQSERGDRYREAVETLLASGHAYRCTCTPEEVDAMRERGRAAGGSAGYDGTCRDRGIGPDHPEPFCVRLRVSPTGPTRWNDAIAGPSGQDAAELDDFVIARTDGSAIYHLAVVVDDHEMGVTHVIRGREHLPSTSRQLLLYDGLGWEPPIFAHVPLLVEPGGKKLSKRHAAVSVEAYRERGFLPEAVVNFIARLGWGHGDTEVVSRDELASLFDLADVGKSPSGVSEEKLLWLSQHYVKGLPRERLLEALAPFLEAAASQPVAIDPGLADLVDLLRERSQSLADMAERARFYLVDEIELDPKAARKHLKAQAREPLRELRTALEKLEPWDDAAVQAAFEATLEALELPLGKLAQPVRVAVTGRGESPGIFETLACLGRDRTLARLDHAVAYIEALPSD